MLGLCESLCGVFGVQLEPMCRTELCDWIYINWDRVPTGLYWIDLLEIERQYLLELPRRLLKLLGTGSE